MRFMNGAMEREWDEIEKYKRDRDKKKISSPELRRC
jgi:hypothetical protein